MFLFYTAVFSTIIKLIINRECGLKTRNCKIGLHEKNKTQITEMRLCIILL